MEARRNYQRNSVVRRTVRRPTDADAINAMLVTCGYYVAGAETEGSTKTDAVFEEQKIGENDILFYGIFDKDVEFDRTKIFRPFPAEQVVDERNFQRETRLIIERVYDTAVPNQQAQVREQSTGTSTEHTFQRRAQKVIQKVKDLAKPRKQAPEREQRKGSFAFALVRSNGWVTVAEFGEFISFMCRKGKVIKKNAWSLKSLAGKITEITNRIRDGTFKRREGLNISSRELDFDTDFIALASHGLIGQEVENQEIVRQMGNIVTARDVAEFYSKEAIKQHTETPVACMVILTREDVQDY